VSTTLRATGGEGGKEAAKTKVAWPKGMITLKEPFGQKGEKKVVLRKFFVGNGIAVGIIHKIS